MTPFHDYDLRLVIESQWNKVKDKIDKFSNEEIMANDIDVLASNIYEEFYIEPVTIHAEDFSSRSIKQGKIQKYVEPFWRDFGGSEYIEVDGVIGTFVFPFSGDKLLFQCRASTFSLSGYPEIAISNDSVIVNIEKTLEEMKNAGSVEQLLKNVDGIIDSIKSGINYANADVFSFNNTLKNKAQKLLEDKKAKVESFYDIAKMLEVPIEKKEYSQSHIPLERKIVPIAHSYKNEKYYGIHDQEYKDILDSIKHYLSTYERTTASYKSMGEEDLRNTLLAHLNATYKGGATGEAFRNKGKTDICIEHENRAAFVAECKMWNGPREIEKALKQLDGYLTWRDCKTALIYFVRRKDFFKTLETARDALTKVPEMKNVKEADKNIYDCLFLSQSNPGQQVKICVMLFNLYAD